jgi:hypothetical protein
VTEEEVKHMTETNYEAPAIIDIDDDAEFAVAPGTTKVSRWRYAGD